MSFNSSLEEVKKAGQDFEWYPTTREILSVLNKDLKRYQYEIRLCDVGAGNGSIFDILEDLRSKELDKYKDRIDKRRYTKYAIEKSQVLISKMKSDIFVIGTDFHHQSFIDKRMDVIFCNPPYSEYEEWAIKLIKESNCNELYLVIPDRWKSSEKIKEAIKLRAATDFVLGNFSFTDSEFRKARANVDIIRISYDKYGYHQDKLEMDPFELWFNEFFHISANKTETREYDKNKKKRNKINEITDKSTLIDNLVDFYTTELQNLISNYKAVETLNSELLEELNINLSGLKSGLKGKISGLKNLYWRELFNNLEAITDRLTEKSRQSLLDTLFKHTSVDFTHDNIYSIVIWAIKNTNKYIDSQLIDLYDTLTAPKNIRGYKSNKHMIDDTWRNLDPWNFRRDKDNLPKYQLDYRCVCEGSYGVTSEWVSSSRTHRNTITDRGHSFIKDLFTIAKNLNYNIIGDSQLLEWTSGKKHLFYRKLKDECVVGDLTLYGKVQEVLADQYRIKDEWHHKGSIKSVELFAEIKCFMNGNIHYKLNQKFMQKFNIEAGRLKGWIRTPREASEELNISISEVSEYFKSNLQIVNSNIKLLN